MTPDPPSAIEQARKLEIALQRAMEAGICTQQALEASILENGSRRAYLVAESNRLFEEARTLALAAAHGRGQGEKRIEYRYRAKAAASREWWSCNELSARAFNPSIEVEQREVIEGPWTPLSEDTP